MQKPDGLQLKKELSIEDKRPTSNNEYSIGHLVYI